ncbi:MAG: isoleucine--tRNA ligase [Clostridiaceae bacterium]|nr:isoleucine--tRNA ligase [Clostridiaceae bacterium]
MPQDYNSTLNLPETGFPMRAGLPQREPEFLKAWEAQNTFDELLKKNAERPKYILHDGPPFSNGNIHMGTALNKVLKDFINRYKAMSGYLTPYVPGWDNHGMPIESAIIKQNKLDRRKMSIPEFRSACQAFAEKFVKIQMDSFVRLGVMGRWDDPYLTMAPSFEAEEVKIFGDMFKKGYIYKGLKPVYWCPHDETALAEAEIEYKDDPCTSIYVKFAVKDDLGKLRSYGDPNKIFFIIWTTTTWTLPGNLAIALHPAESYVLAKASNGETYITAEALLDSTMAAGKISGYEIIARMKGAEFEGMTAQHPFIDRDSRLVLADYVTMDSGTGCVHTAPGFGADDYITCRKYGIDLIVPVDDHGYQTKDAGKFAGMRYDESNEAILKNMTETGALFAREEIVHSYPHCWRCKSPIIFRATPQWFCSVDAFKNEAVAAAHAVRWIPAWGEDRMISMIRERADWCISRQRHWGLPIPVFYCQDCGKPVCTDETIGKVSDIFAKEGSNAWYAKETEELLPEGFVCPHCGGIHFTRETDTLDGWFDSGSTHIASMELRDKTEWPADLYLEGADQYRGWFQSSLLVAVGAKGRGAPYKTVLTHGWVVDGEGKAMHKSLGNGVDPADVIKQYGADVLRLWAASADYRVDVRCSDAIFRQLSQAYLKIRNTCRYMLGNLKDFNPEDLVASEEMLPLDRWAVSRCNALIRTCMQGYEDFEYHIVTHALNDFCVVDMSSLYLDVIKDRLYCDEKNGLKRRSAQTAMYLILDAMTRLLAPILCFTADEIWHAMPHQASDDARNVIFNQMQAPYAAYQLTQEELGHWSELLSLRSDINLALEEARAAKLIGKPLEAKVVLRCTAEEKSKLMPDAELLRDLLIVSALEIEEGHEGKPCANHESVYLTVLRAEGEKCARCWCYSTEVGKNAAHPTLCPRCAEVVSKL